jgi:hypothetical protein
MLFRESFVRFRLPFKPPLSLLKKLPLPAYRKRSANERNAVASPRKRPRMRGAFNCLLETRNAFLSFRCGLDLRRQTRMSERDAGNFGELLLCGRFQRVLTLSNRISEMLTIKPRRDSSRVSKMRFKCWTGLAMSVRTRSQRFFPPAFTASRDPGRIVVL